MKPQLVKFDGRNVFTAYGEDYVSVNSVRHCGNIVVFPNHVIHDWTQATFEALCVADFEFLATLDTEILLLGTGNQWRFPRSELMQPLILAQKGLEVMDIQAACRTYNILISTERKVAAALIFS